MSKKVNVGGYYRSSGAYVSGYTRSSPGSGGGGSRSSAGSSMGSSGSASYGGTGGSGTTYVHGYTRSDGREVSGYTRSTPASSSSSRETPGASGSASYGGTGGSGTTYVHGYTRSDGREVSGYTRTTPTRRADTASSSSSPSTSATPGASGEGRVYKDNAYNRKHDRVGEPVGTHVISSSSTSTATSASTAVYKDNAFNRKHGRVGKPIGTCPISRSSTSTATSASTAVYKDNAFNRKHGRVGKPIGTCAISRSSTSTATSAKADGSEKPERYYVDNSHNRKLGRVGLLIPSRKGRRKDIQEELVVKNTLDDLIYALQQMQFNQGERCDYEYARYRLERETVEESWKKEGITPSTDVSCLTSGITCIPFDELKVEREIGRGGFGEVHACRWHGTPVAYKKLLLQHLSKKRLDSLVTEIKILAALNHPNTVRLFGVVVEEEKKGIVMEYMQRSLFRAIFIDEEEFSNEKKTMIVSQVASAVEYLHTREQKIAHCDIKSENVLLDGKDNAKLGDFGLSTLKNATDSSRSSAAPPPPGQGTPRYSAPEVLRGELLTSINRLIQADVYSLAIVVFEVVTEEEPFEGLSVKQLEANVGRGNLRPESDNARLSQPLLDLLAKCWEDSASKRPTATDFLAQWKKIPELYIEN